MVGPTTTQPILPPTQTWYSTTQPTCTTTNRVNAAKCFTFVHKLTTTYIILGKNPVCIRADAGTSSISVYLVTEHTRNNYGTCVHFVCVLSMSFRLTAKCNIHWGHMAHGTWHILHKNWLIFKKQSQVGSPSFNWSGFQKLMQLSINYICYQVQCPMLTSSHLTAKMAVKYCRMSPII